MNLVEQLSALVMNNLQPIILVIILLLLLVLIVFININIRLGNLNKRYKTMMRGQDGGNLESLLLKQIEQTNQAVAKVEIMEALCQRLEVTNRACMQKIGLVRFNAFEDMGGDLSFALALLDSKNNGVVISSIYGRNESRIYAKPVENGQSSYHLSDEEKSSIHIAKEKISN
ncbi:MAG: hypothetical protein H6Q73_3476 [Firmicutes bacterium]|nr:hypothetical protein [Bacillota bacterium]